MSVIYLKIMAPENIGSGWRVVTAEKPEPQEVVTSRNLGREGAVIHR
jgi:hypothetical protein